MERLTQWFGFGKGCRVAGIASHLEEKHTAEELVDVLSARLAVYEDTGLEPEDVLRISNILRLVGEDFNCRLVFVAQALVKYAEYTKAEREGRLVMLPCKVGDIVYGAETAPVIPLYVIEPAVYMESAEGGDFETLDNFGRTVFLTREEAEAALEGGSDG